MGESKNLEGNRFSQSPTKDNGRRGYCSRLSPFQKMAQGKDKQMTKGHCFRIWAYTKSLSAKIHPAFINNGFTFIMNVFADICYLFLSLCIYFDVNWSENLHYKMKLWLNEITLKCLFFFCFQSTQIVNSYYIKNLYKTSDVHGKNL